MTTSATSPLFPPLQSESYCATRPRMLTEDDCTGWIMLLMRALSMVHSEGMIGRCQSNRTFLALGATDWPWSNPTRRQSAVPMSAYRDRASDSGQSIRSNKADNPQNQTRLGGFAQFCQTNPGETIGWSILAHQDECGSVPATASSFDRLCVTRGQKCIGFEA